MTLARSWLKSEPEDKKERRNSNDSILRLPLHNHLEEPLFLVAEGSCLVSCETAQVPLIIDLAAKNQCWCWPVEEETEGRRWRVALADSVIGLGGRDMKNRNRKVLMLSKFEVMKNAQ